MQTNTKIRVTDEQRKGWGWVPYPERLKRTDTHKNIKRLTIRKWNHADSL